MPAASPWSWLSLLALLAIGAARTEAATTRSAGLNLSMPNGFRPVPSAVARREAAPLVELLQRAGLRAVSSLRARQDRLGAPASPVASITAARVRVLTESLASEPDLAHADLVGALQHASGRDPDALLLAPTPIVVAGRSGFELGFTRRSAGGRTQLSRWLLLPARGEVIVLALSSQDLDPKRWEATWSRVAQSLTLEATPVSSGHLLWPLLPLVLAAVALGSALLQRRRPMPAPNHARIEALLCSRAAPRGPQPAEEALLPTAGVSDAEVAVLPPPREPLPVGPPAVTVSAERPSNVGPSPATPCVAPSALAEGDDLLALIDETRQGGGGMSLLELKLARQGLDRAHPG